MSENVAHMLQTTLLVSKNILTSSKYKRVFTKTRVAAIEHDSSRLSNGPATQMQYNYNTVLLLSPKSECVAACPQVRGHTVVTVVT